MDFFFLTIQYSRFIQSSETIGSTHSNPNLHRLSLARPSRAPAATQHTIVVRLFPAPSLRLPVAIPAPPLSLPHAALRLPATAPCRARTAAPRKRHRASSSPTAVPAHVATAPRGRAPPLPHAAVRAEHAGAEGCSLEKKYLQQFNLVFFKDP